MHAASALGGTRRRPADAATLLASSTPARKLFGAASAFSQIAEIEIVPGQSTDGAMTTLWRIAGYLAFGVTVLVGCDASDPSSPQWHVHARYALGPIDRYEVSVAGAPAIVDISERDSATTIIVSDENEAPVLLGFSDEGRALLADPQLDVELEWDPDDPYHAVAMTALRDGELPLGEEYRSAVSRMPGGSALPALESDEDLALCLYGCDAERRLCEFSNRNQILDASPHHPCDLNYEICTDACYGLPS